MRKIFQKKPVAKANAEDNRQTCWKRVPEKDSRDRERPPLALTWREHRDGLDPAKVMYVLYMYKSGPSS